MNLVQINSMNNSRVYSFSTVVNQFDSCTIGNQRPIERPSLEESVRNGKRKCRKSRVLEKTISKGKTSYCKRVTSDFLQNSSLFVFKNIETSNTLLQKMFWIVVLLIGIGGCVQQVTQFLVCYFKYPVVIDIEKVRAFDSVFPAVTICNMNSIRQDFKECLGKRIYNKDCLSPGQETDFEIYENITQPICYNDLDIYRDVGNTNASSPSFKELFTRQKLKSRRKYGHQIEEFYVVGKFDDFNYLDYPDFQPSVSSIYGNCYTFNAGEFKYISTKSGSRGGLYLELNLELDKYTAFSSAAGVRVQVHDPYTQNDADTKGLTISPGFATSIAITKEVHTRLPPPYKDKCKKYDSGNDKNSCSNKCLENATLSECFCSLLKNTNDDTPRCDFTNPLVLCCLSRVKSKSTCNCPLACLETKYKMQVSSVVWPSRNYYDNKKYDFYGRLNGTYGRLPYEKARETYLKLKIYYNTFDYTIYKQYPMYLNSELLSQIGGQIGLWLGLSLTFIFECIENIML